MLAVFGDSNVAGWRADAPKLLSKTKTWPYILKQAIKAQSIAVNGMPGRTAQESVQAFQEFVKAVNITTKVVLFVMIGVNDLAIMSGESAFNAVERLVSIAKDVGITRICYVKHPGIRREQLPEMFSQFQSDQCAAAEKEFAELLVKLPKVVDVPLEAVGQDGLHLTEQGHQMVAALLQKAYAELVAQ